MARHHQRKLSNPAMTTLDAVVAMADGSAGAIPVLIGLVTANPLALFMLDDLGIYGESVYLAYNDVYDRDLDALIEGPLDSSVLTRLKKLEDSRGLPR